MNAESDLEMVERHVRQGREHVERQRAIMERLRDKGEPQEMAGQLLAEFETTLRQHEEHLERLQAEGGGGPVPRGTTPS